MDSYKGFNLFNDLGNADDKARNRGRILCNIAVDHQRGGKFSIKGVALSSGYIRAIPAAERRMALEEFVIAMRKEGFAITGTAEQKERAIEQAAR